ncbi:MAG: pyridoxal-phosphate dependent enzyme [Bacteroidales bacterium]|nr:pyridoxal-phosphate dependent enzyme [Bacteroidales bacterium]MDD4209867.1 pyridoxal-phosphate dependent enzyme [Bacteroidales bacterium]
MKYQLVCVKCKSIIPDFAEWFSYNQTCPKCGIKHAEIEYDVDYTSLKKLYNTQPNNFFHYFDFLPIIKKENIVTFNEGSIPIESWSFLKEYAKKHHNIDCEVVVYRNDLNGGTQTFKDVAAALAASIFKENGIKEYCVASTGNTATAYSKYLAAAGICFTVFVPEIVDNETVEEIKSHKQNIHIAKGDYVFAKKMAADFHAEHKVLMSAGNIDPIRVEAKRTMVFEFMRQMGKMPDVYIQAVSGGTGPIAIDKGVREIEKIYPEVLLPRMLLVQQDNCDPMVQGWEIAKKNNFPEGYEKHYPIIDNPQTMVSILSTGNPGMFPVVAPIVKKSKGTFLRIKEDELTHFARIVRDEKQILLGPASIVCLAGFYQALKEDQIKNGETVLINIGESAIRSSNFIKML